MSSFRLRVRHTEVSPEGLPSSFCPKNGLSVLVPRECHKSWLLHVCSHMCLCVSMCVHTYVFALLCVPKYV